MQQQINVPIFLFFLFFLSFFLSLSLSLDYLNINWVWFSRWVWVSRSWKSSETAAVVSEFVLFKSLYTVFIFEWIHCWSCESTCSIFVKYAKFSVQWSTPICLFVCLFVCL
jgi:hypothetical protein